MIQSGLIRMDHSLDELVRVQKLSLGREAKTASSAVDSYVNKT